MKTIAAMILIAAGLGCSTKPCVDGEKTSHSGYWGFGGASRTSYDPCKQKCCEPGWTRGCACSERCPCWKRHK